MKFSSITLAMTAMAAFLVPSTAGRSELLLPGLSGDTAENGDAAIFGGEEITQVVPWFVFIGNCGGILIHKDIVLTSAHCVDKFPAGFPGFPTEVSVGILDTTGTNPGTTMKVLGGIIHPDWVLTETVADWGPDFAVIKLEQLSSNEVAPLNSVSTEPADGDSLFALGLGEVDAAPNPSTVLKGGVVKVKQCDVGEFTNNPICAVPSPDTTCRGDSGGPLVTRTEISDGTFVYGPVLGLTSFARGSCGAVSEMGFARISDFLPWIQEQVCSLSIDPPASCGSNADVTPYRYTLSSTYFFPEKVLRYHEPTAAENEGLRQVTQIFYRRVIAAVNALSYEDVDVNISFQGVKTSDVTVFATWDLEVTFKTLSKYPSRADLQTTIDSVKKELYVSQFINNAPPGGSIYQK